jgi:hypothetical protein
MVGCFSCGTTRSPSPPKKKKSSSSPNYGYNLQRMFGGNPKNTKSMNLPPQVMSMIANKMKKGKNVRKLRSQLPESYARYITLRTPPPPSRGGAASLYRAQRKAATERYPFNKNHILNVRLPIAYKRNNWTHYSFSGGKYHFYNANGTRFTITKKGRRINNTIPLMMNNVVRYPRRNGNNWQSYQKRVQRYTRYVKGENTRRNILDEIEEAVLGGAPNKYLYNSNEVQDKWIRTGLMEKQPNGNKYRWSNRALLFYLAKRHSNNYGKIPGYGITRRNGPIKMTRSNIIENLNMLV